MTAIGGGTHSIGYGETLSGLAARFGTTVEQLMSANSNIANANTIYAGHQLVVPGAQTGPAFGGVSGAGHVDGMSQVGGSSAAAIAEQFIGRNAGELKHSGELPMESWVPNNVNCANFVSACLQQSGVINPGQASASVDMLANNLRADGWQTVSLQNAQPGDVVLMQRDGQSHVVLFAGFENGQPKFIGSNNINPDGSQQISWGGASGNYEIIAPPR